MNNLPEKVGFGASKELIEVEEVESGVAASVAREQQEIQAAIITAKKFPRDENEAYAKVMKSLQRPSLAEAAAYSFPRGGKNITGPSIDLARELARCWKNIRFGIRIVKESNDKVHIKGYAYDAESNNYVEAEDEFLKKIQRKREGVTVWVAPDERDLRELVNRRGAILVRNCILQLIPPDIVDDALMAASQTLTKAANGELKQNREDAVRRIALAFANFGVTTAMLDEKLGHPLSLTTDSELVELRKVYKSILDGISTASEHFNTGEPKGESGELTQKLKSETAKIKKKEAVQGDIVPVSEEPKGSQS